MGNSQSSEICAEVCESTYSPKVYCSLFVTRIQILQEVCTVVDVRDIRVSITNRK